MRADKPSVFTGDAAALGTVDINAPAATATKPSVSDLGESYHKQSKEATDAAAAVYAFIAQLCSIGEAFDLGVRPFAPAYQGPDGRSLLPEDLSAQDLKCIEELAPRVAHPVLRARLFDILWVESRNHTACAEAARSYLLRAKLNDSSRNWFRAVSSYQRALQLAATLGRAKPLFQEAAEALIGAARDESIDHPGARNAQLMRLMLRMRVGDPAEFASRAGLLADGCRKANQLELANTYLDIQADWHKADGDEVKEQSARRAAGELMVEIAEARAQRPTGGAMAAASMLVDAIEALRRSGGDPARVEQLRARLVELQKKTRDEMGQFSRKFDISKAVQAARELVAGHPFPEALLRFLLGIRTLDPVKVRQEVLDLANDNPLTSFIDATIVDEKGRTVAHEPGLFGKTGEALESALEVRMFSHAAKFSWSIRVSNFINPARLQILNDHQPSFEDLYQTLVHNNPFIPPGHEEIFLRGLHAGFHGDFIIAVHLLVPQVENSLRHILEEHGVDVSNLQSDRTQPVKILTGLLAMEETRKMLGASLHFEIRGHLLEKTGFNFRNQVAHGFVNEADCYSPAGVATWWLVLRLCLHFAMTGGGKFHEEPATG